MSVNSCFTSNVTALHDNDAIAVAEVSGQMIAYMADSSGSSYPYYCFLKGGGSSHYEIDETTCVQMTTVNSLDLHGVAGGTIGFIAN